MRFILNIDIDGFYDYDILKEFFKLKMSVKFLNFL